MKLLKLLKLTSLQVCLLIIVSCKKEAVTIPVTFTSTTYKPLGGYDSDGKPDYLVASDTISSTLRTYITNLLPESKDLRNLHPELLNANSIADIPIHTSADVYITYVSNGTGYTNTFGFYTYTTGQSPASAKDIKNITYIFPNAGIYTTLQPGAKVHLGRFDAGISLGFVILQNGWNRNTHTIDSSAVHFCSNDILNPEVAPSLKKHAVLINYPEENKVLIGFEDIDRTSSLCDNDFNDMMFYCTVVP
ncbi:MAG: hypothetical protein JWR61_4281 [Ferruginibacter sp.]|uniref:DUF4114 domain-containing protein n=1 Tax=Ferruginibacter sp. TaxID=1940288 RepID=UPI002657F95B|nr:DUF4114 domain-containing protein [Ferruginibacter sp.]MDB5279326.1 hypothetical protein [Ferruginibacter sp.]